MARERRTKLYPTQIRYQQRNPMISFRIPIQEYTELKEIAKNSGRTLAELVRKRVREASQVNAAHKRGYEDGFKTTSRNLEIKVKQAREKGYEEGAKISKKRRSKIIEEAFKEGYETAKSRYEITYPCAVCGNMMTMYPGKNDHQEMQELMVGHGWKHSKCEE